MTDPYSAGMPCEGDVGWGKKGRRWERRGTWSCQGDKRTEPEVCHKEEVDFYLMHIRRIAEKPLLRILKGENLSSS